MAKEGIPSSSILDISEEVIFSSGIPDVSETHTINIRDLIGELEVASESGLRNIQGTAFASLLQAIPVPVLLVDQSHSIIFANQYWEKINRNYLHLLNQQFSTIFANKSVAREADSILERGFSYRKPLVASAVLEIQGIKIWARMYFRSLRMGSKSALIILVEDLTSEKKQLFAIQQNKEALLKARKELEERVASRTAELKTMNDSLLREIEFRKHAEQSLYSSRASFTSIVEKTSEGIFVIDSDNFILYANSAAASFMNFSKDQLTGQRLRLKIDMDQVTEVRGRRLTGDMGIFELRVEATDWNGSPAHLLMLRDITDRKRVQQEILKAEKLESLELIAGGIAHDFNNLLTATSANISLAKMHGIHDTEQHKALLNAEKAVIGAKHLTYQLLTFARGGEPIKKKVLLNTILKDNVTLALSGTKIRSDLLIKDNLWSAELDPYQIGQAFQNIFINAVQAMPEGGNLTVYAENFSINGKSGLLGLKGGKYLRILVKDTGCGISTENIDKIFDPYFTTKPKGSGIGLAAVHSVIRKHGGAIEVQSEIDNGSTFCIYLPASIGDDYDPEVPDSQERPAFGTGKILVMDDDDSIRGVLQELLTVLGYEVTLAEEGSECIQLYERAKSAGEPFSAVIMDLTIPGGMGGKEAMKKLIQIDPDIKAIVSSGYSTDPIMSNYEQFGFKGIVAKPYGVLDLSKALSKLLEDT